MDKLSILFKVKPSSSVSKFEVISEKVVKVFLKAPAIRGKANKELIKMISKLTCVNRDDIMIKSGERSKQKLIYIMKPSLTWVNFVNLIEKQGRMF